MSKINNLISNDEIYPQSVFGSNITGPVRNYHKNSTKANIPAEPQDHPIYHSDKNTPSIESDQHHDPIQPAPIKSEKQDNFSSFYNDNSASRAHPMQRTFHSTAILDTSTSPNISYNQLPSKHMNYEEQQHVRMSSYSRTNADSSSRVYSKDIIFKNSSSLPASPGTGTPNSISTHVDSSTNNSRSLYHEDTHNRPNAYRNINFDSLSHYGSHYNSDKKSSIWYISNKGGDTHSVSPKSSRPYHADNFQSNSGYSRLNPHYYAYQRDQNLSENNKEPHSQINNYNTNITRNRNINHLAKAEINSPGNPKCLNAYSNSSFDNAPKSMILQPPQPALNKQLVLPETRSPILSNSHHLDSYNRPIPSQRLQDSSESAPYSKPGTSLKANKQEIRLQRNRIAAKECRLRKKKYVQSLEEKVSSLEQDNANLLKKISNLEKLLKQRT